MEIEFTCLSCTRTFAVPAAELLRMDYLSCICCEKPVPIDLINSLQRVCKSISPPADNQKNETFWHIRFNAKK